jgi:hypothetical protein
MKRENRAMNFGRHPGAWKRPTLFVALAGFAAFVALPAVQAGATTNCQLGSFVDYSGSCNFDTNGDGRDDWYVSDTNGDGILDTSSIDTDYDGQVETYYTIKPVPSYDKVSLRYDHDGDALYDDEEIGLYGTDPYNEDTDWDGYTDSQEISLGSSPLDSYCTPNGCG